MKVKHLFLGVGAVLCGGVFCVPVFATSYTREVEVEFNFNSTMNVTIDTADIEILDLAPGTSADSNIVGFTVSTNNIVGYTASATVGWSGNTTTNMTHTNGTNTFASIATDADLPSLTTDNTWGYATSTDNGTSWSNFSGLPLYTDDAKQIAYTDSPANDTMKFKINAKASTSQPSGDYKNKINFIIVANVPPRDFPDIVPSDGPKDPETGLPTIQSIDEDLCDQVEAYDTQFQVTDIRDHKNYWISKLRDGKCWMTQNLDFDIDSTKTYTSATTDLGWNGTGYTNTSWQPLRSTIPSTSIQNDGYGSYFAEWGEDGYSPYSADVGDWYFTGTWYSDPSTYNPYIDGGSANFKQTPFSGNGTHGHVGNYYNWSAAVATNNTNSYTDEGEAQNSICPAGWRLPRVTSYSTGQIGTNDYYNLLLKYTDYTQNNDDRGFMSAPLYFIRGGYILWNGNITYGEQQGYYWSSDYYDWKAENMSHRKDYIYIFQSQSRAYGFPVRCVVRSKNKLTVNFDANSGTGSMANQQVKYGGTASLNNNTYTRSGYIFNGWNTKADGTGVGYGNRSSYTATTDTAVTLVTLYAQWIPESSPNSGNAGKTLQDAYEMAYVTNPGAFQEGDNNKHGLYVPHKTNGVYDGIYFEATQASDYEGIPANDLRFAIQDIDMEINGVKVCDYATVIGSEAYVLDLRDFSSYHIVKAKDGRCWLADNLSLDLLNPDVLSSLSPSNTNADSASLTSLRSGNRASGNQYATSGITSSTSGGYYSIPQIYRLIKNNSNSTDVIQELRTSKYGILYNYCAATAGSYCYGNENTYGTSYNNPNSAIDAEYDICPSGWRMPTGGYIGTSGSTAGGGEYQQLHDAYDDDTDSTRLVARLPLSGYYDFYYASTYSQNSTGYYWSSTRYENENRIFEMAVNADSVNPISTSQYLDGRYLGYSVRCIAK